MRDIQIGLVLLAFATSAACSINSGSGEDPDKILDPLFGDGAAGQLPDGSTSFDGSTGTGFDASVDDSSMTKADTAPPPGGCDPTSVSAAACFVASNLSCFGIGGGLGGDGGPSATCGCMVMCNGCMFDYKCMNDAMEACNSSSAAASRVAAGPCANACASKSSAASEMGTIRMCGGFTSP